VLRPVLAVLVRFFFSVLSQMIYLVGVVVPFSTLLDNLS
jgi:hypothetical protein